MPRDYFSIFRAQPLSIDLSETFSSLATVFTDGDPDEIVAQLRSFRRALSSPQSEAVCDDETVALVRSLYAAIEAFIRSTGSAQAPNEIMGLLQQLGNAWTNLEPKQTSSETLWEFRFNVANLLFNVAQMVSGAFRKDMLVTAITGFENTLETAESVAQPIELLKIRTNKANALKRLSETVSGDEKRQFIQDAIAGLKNARMAVTPDEFPQEWVIATLNLANTFGMAVDVVENTNRLEMLNQADQAYDSALAVRADYEDKASLIATLQMNKANVLSRKAAAVGGCNGRDILVQSISAYELARDARSPTQDPKGWAITTMNLANARLHLARLIGGENARELLHLAISDCRDASDNLSDGTTPFEWAAAKLIQSVAYMIYADYLVPQESQNALSQAIEGFSETTSVFGKETMPYYWTAATVNGAISKMRLADFFQTDERTHLLQEAISEFANVKNTIELRSDPYGYAAALNGQSICQYNLAGQLTAKEARQHLNSAIAGFKHSLENVFSKETMPAMWAMIEHNRANAFLDLGDISRTAKRKEYYKQASVILADLHEFHRAGPSTPALITAQRNYMRAEAKRSEWENAAAIGRAALSHAPAALLEAQSSAETTDRLGRLTGIGDTTGYAYLREGKVSQAIRSIEAGRVYLLREEIAQREARLSSHNRAQLIKLKERVAMAQSAYDGLAKIFNSLAGNEYHTDFRREFNLAAEELAHAREDFQEFARANHLTSPALPLSRTLLKGVASLGEQGAAVVLSISPLGTNIVVLRYGLSSLNNAHVVAVPAFNNTVLSKLLSDGSSGWLHDYATMQDGLKTVAQSDARNNNRTDLTALANVVGQWNNRVETMLPRLWRLLMRHVDQAIRQSGLPSGVPVNLIVPGQLSILPLHAAGRKTKSGWQCFSDKWEVSYAPSLQVLAALRRQAKKHKRIRKTLLAVTDPLGDLGVTMNPANHAFDPAHIIDLNRDRARPSAVSRNLRKCQYASFFCHGVWSNTNPDASGLILANGEKFGAKDLRKIQLDGYRLIALGACQSGLTSIAQSPDEHQGLPTAFLQSGATAVAATHWPMLTTTIEPAIRRLFEKHIGEGQRPAQALMELSRNFRLGKMPPADRTHPIAAITPFDNDGAQAETVPANSDKSESETYPVSLLTDQTLPVHWAALSLFGV